MQRVISLSVILWELHHWTAIWISQKFCGRSADGRRNRNITFILNLFSTSWNVSIHGVIHATDNGNQVTPEYEEYKEQTYTENSFSACLHSMSNSHCWKCSLWEKNTITFPKQLTSSPLFQQESSKMLFETENKLKAYVTRFVEMKQNSMFWE